MRTSNLPNNFVVLFLFFLFASSYTSGCTSRKLATNFTNERSESPAPFAININTTDEQDLQRLPHVGPVLAKKIIEHRERYGPFRKTDHLLIVDGVSEKRFLKFRKLIRTE